MIILVICDVNISDSDQQNFMVVHEIGNKKIVTTLQENCCN